VPTVVHEREPVYPASGAVQYAIGRWGHWLNHRGAGDNDDDDVSDPATATTAMQRRYGNDTAYHDDDHDVCAMLAAVHTEHDDGLPDDAVTISLA
jgi:hypothetical protein